MLINAPTQIPRSSLAHRRRHRRQVSRYMVLEAALADVAKQLLQLGDAHHAGAAKSLERIVGELAFPHVALNRALAIVGRKTRETHRPRFHPSHARPVSVVAPHRAGDDLL